MKTYTSFFFYLIAVAFTGLVVIVTVPSIAFAHSHHNQENTINGKVQSSDGEALVGVSVTIKNTHISTMTNSEGVFNLQNIPENTVLVFSFVGFKTQEVVVSGHNRMNISMEEDVAKLDEAVVIGYGTARKKDLTGSVTRVDASVYKNQPTTQLTEMLAGTVPGIQVDQGSSASGGASMEIRGPNSLTAGSSPMVVVDGAIFNGNMSDISPSDIESMDILKDASAAAIYGARAASGVILITTKRGLTGKPSISLSAKTGVSDVTSDNFATRSPSGYLDYRRDFFRTLGGPQPDYYWFSPDDLPQGVTPDEWRNASNNPNADDTREWLSRLNFFPLEIENYINGDIIDWKKQVLRNAVKQDYDLSVNGGTNDIKYYWSLGSLNNQGVIVGDQFSTIRSRVNFDLKINNWLKVGMNAQYAKRDESAVPADLNGMYTVSPYSDMYNDDGTIRWYPHGYVGAQNPLINYYGQDRNRKIESLFSTLFSEVSLPFGISYRLSFQPRSENTKEYNYWSPQTIMGGDTYSNGRATRMDASVNEWMLDNLLKWNHDFGDHRLDVTLLYNAEKYKSWESDMANQTFLPSPVLGYHGIEFGNNPYITSNDIQYSGDGLMGRVNYSFKDRYLITGSVRRDGFSAFGQDNPRAYFPAAAFAWRLSNEPFFKSNLFNDLKLRVSWGVNGNRDIGPYAAFSQINSDPYYDGSSVQMGVYTSTLSNKLLQWEQTESTNIGMDVSALQERLNITLDYYLSSTTHLLVQRTLPRITGFDYVADNIGKLVNRGLELSVSSVNINHEAFKWKTSFNFSFNRNQIKSLFGEKGTYLLEGKSYTGEIPDFENKWFIGQPIDVVWDYNILGVWQTEEAAEAAKYNLKPGDLKVSDLDANYALEALQDKMFIGYTQPRYLLGLRNDVDFLKNFTASIFIRADLGNIRPFPQSVASWSTFDRTSTANYPYWTPDNRSNDYPRLNMNSSPYGGGIMLYKPSWFVRVQDVSLAYSLPTELIRRAQLKGARVFMAARNLFTFDQWPGWDPESGDQPMPRTLSLGVDISL